jgi:RNA 2',3'-cyclic 3'-phosphodiesterase
MRLFIAMNFPEELRARWAAQGESLRAIAPQARWEPTAHMHLTLAFLGEQPEGILGSLKIALDGITAAASRLSLEMHGVGAFPNWRRPRVVWLGVVPAPALLTLAQSVAIACRALGIPGEDRPFHPHITLARFDDRLSPGQVGQLERAARGVADRTTAEVQAVELMSSTLGPGRARHEVVHRALFR